MGVMNFLLPADLAAEAAQELNRASVAGGQDLMPYPTTVELHEQRLTVRRGVDESGFLQAPWRVNGLGQLMITTATLMERAPPYRLPLELARGKINQLRGQASDWVMVGLTLPEALARDVQQASLSFSRAVVDAETPTGPQTSQQALLSGCRAGEHLVQVYAHQVFDIRHQRQGQLDTALGARLRALPRPEHAALLRQTCNSIMIAFPWDQLEPAESAYRWEPFDALVDWATAQGVQVIGGPLVDFSGANLPDWLWERERDPGSLSVFLCDYVETVVKRYRTRIRTWQVASAANSSRILAAMDEELLWFAVRVAEAARSVDPGMELIVGIAQPWGDYLATQDHTHSPFVFADTLIRTGLKLHALDIELIMGVSPRGSYCRDLLDTSRILDLYALLGVPLQVTLGYPSSTAPDPGADPDVLVDGGHWRDGVNAKVQAEWAARYAELAVCKPYVRGVHWVHFADAEPHLLPNCGLVDGSGAVKPALARLRELREKHLR